MDEFWSILSIPCLSLVNIVYRPLSILCDILSCVYPVSILGQYSRLSRIYVASMSRLSYGYLASIYGYPTAILHISHVYLSRPFCISPVYLVNFASIFSKWKIIMNFWFDRYEYDDHYFLTDPKEFIYEFYPLQSEWQLLKNPITLAEFEELPFVRSLFFRYQLSFPSDNMKSVMHTDSTGN